LFCLVCVLHLRLSNEFQRLRNDYSGMPLTDAEEIDTELVSHLIADLKRGKAVGFDGLVAEHLLFAHESCIKYSNVKYKYKYMGFVASTGRLSNYEQCLLID